MAIRQANPGGAFGKRHYPDGAIPPEALTGSKNYKYLYDTFQFAQGMASGGGAAAGTANGISVLFTANPWNVIHTYAVIGTLTGVLIPVIVTDGLDVKFQAESSEGGEFGWGVDVGVVSLRERLAFQAGVDRDFFYKLTFSVADVSGSDALYMGFRKAAAYDATFANYTDYALLGWDGTDATQNVDVFLKGGTGSNTGNAYDTGQDFADAATHTWEVRVNAGGGVQFRIDDAIQSAGGAFTFTASDILIPIFRYTNQAAGNTGALVLKSLNIGYARKGGE